MKRLVFLLLLLPTLSYAEPYVVSWEPVTMYTDNTTIPATTPVTYAVFWSVDNTLLTTTQIGNTTSDTSLPFDASVTGRNRGTTVYFTARTFVDGVSSDYASPFAWTLPFKKPGKTRIIHIRFP